MGWQAMQTLIARQAHWMTGTVSMSVESSALELLRFFCSFDQIAVLCRQGGGSMDLKEETNQYLKLCTALINARESCKQVRDARVQGDHVRFKQATLTLLQAQNHDDHHVQFAHLLGAFRGCCTDLGQLV